MPLKAVLQHEGQSLGVLAQVVVLGHFGSGWSQASVTSN